jgi:hypothetical protein
VDQIVRLYAEDASCGCLFPNNAAF